MEMTADEARALIRRQDQQENEACLAEIQQVLQKHGRQLVGEAFITAGGTIDVRVQLVRVENGGPGV